MSTKLAGLIDTLPEPLHDVAGLAVERLSELVVPDDAAPSLLRALACSEYIAETLARYPQMAAELLESGDVLRALEPDELEQRCIAVTGGVADEADIKRELRLFRHRELVRIAWRDLNALADLSETLRDLSALADATMRAALRWSEESLLDRYGKPITPEGNESKFVILGMGKLGGGELNFSSDIDLVFVFSEAAETQGGRQSVTAPEYFRLVAQRVIKLLDERTVDGFVYRVDVRLRPFGTSGPLAVSESAFEEYLMSHGRDWERYAYVKARVVNDWDDVDAFYENILRPFVYRRYLDYGVFHSLREMKAMIEAEGRKRGMKNHVKLGPGGIREVEFIVQTLQLVRGGSIQSLRERRLLPALKELAVHELLPPEVADELADAYCYLRLVENHIQAIADRQTHELPQDELNRARLCLSMDVPDWDTLMERLDRHRDRVQEHFNSTLRRSDEDAPVESADPNLHLTASDNDAVIEQLAEYGFKDPAKTAERLDILRRNSAIQRLDEPGQARLNRLLPQMVVASAAEPSPDIALEGCLRIVEAIGRRSAYFALLNENPAALKRLVSLSARSDFLAHQIAVHPLLLDELLDQRIFTQAPSRADLETDLAMRMRDADADDPESILEAIRNFQQAAVFRTAVADLSEAMPLMHVSDRLTDIAELVVQAALDLSLQEMVAKHGQPTCVDHDGPRPASFAVLGYGKLGGWELGYGSDLDLVFVHDSEGEQQMSDGERPLDNTVYFARLAQRLIHMLTMQTLSGVLYEVDTRLRPSGNSGQMVCSLKAFTKYQKDDAWTWEHQSLLRSRAIAGSESVKEKFDAVRQQALTEFVHFDTLREDVLKMRKRMRGELDKSTETEFHIKQGVGGVIDIEFMVQYLVLENARNNKDLMFWSDNVRQLDALAEAGIMQTDHAARLADIYRDYRSHLHRFALVSKSPLIAREQVADEAAEVTALWDHYLGG